MKAIVSFDQGDYPCALKTAPFGANMSFRKTAFTEYGLFRTDLGRNGSQLTSGEDIEFSKRLLDSDQRLIYNPRVLVYHPVRADRVTKRYFKRWYFDYGRTSIRLANGAGRGASGRGRHTRLLRNLCATLLTFMLARDSRRRFHSLLNLCQALGGTREAVSSLLRKSSGPSIPRFSERRDPDRAEQP